MKNLLIENLNTTKQLGLAVRRVRKLKGVSQAKLANLMMMRQSTISDIENGRGTLESLFKIIQALKINLAISTTSLQDFKFPKKTKAQELLELIEKQRESN